MLTMATLVARAAWPATAAGAAAEVAAAEEVGVVAPVGPTCLENQTDLAVSRSQLNVRFP